MPRAIFRISYVALQHLFEGMDGRRTLQLTGLPEGARVLSVHADFERCCMAFQVEAEGIEEVPDGAELPRLDVQIQATDLAGDFDQAVRMIHDLQQDGGYALGRAVERGEVLRALAGLEERFAEPADTHVLLVALRAIEQRGPWTPPPPPDELVRECEELRGENADLLERVKRLAGRVNDAVPLSEHNARMNVVQQEREAWRRQFEELGARFAEYLKRVPTPVLLQLPRP